MTLQGAPLSILFRCPTVQPWEQDGSLWVCSLHSFLLPSRPVFDVQWAAVVWMFVPRRERFPALAICAHAKLVHAAETQMGLQLASLPGPVQHSGGDVWLRCMHVSRMVLFKALLEACSVPTSTVRARPVLHHRTCSKV